MQWEQELAGLLKDLSAAQDELLAVLGEKRRYLATSDIDGMTQLRPREEELVARLQSCYERRGQLLAGAASEGLPATSLQALSETLPAESRQDLSTQIQQAAQRARFLQHQGLTNWVVVQRTLIHLTHLLEIIATGGRMQPTYGKGNASSSSGALVDQAA